MKYLLIIIASTLSISAAAQTQNIDLSKDLGKVPVTTNKSNAQLLRESRQPVNTPAIDSNLQDKYKLNNNTTTDMKNSSMFLNEDGQRNHTQQQEINLGNGGTKATNTIHYDNAGRVQGSGTSIQFGNKKN